MLSTSFHAFNTSAELRVSLCGFLPVPAWCIILGIFHHFGTITEDKFSKSLVAQQYVVVQPGHCLGGRKGTVQCHMFLTNNPSSF